MQFHILDENYTPVTVMDNDLSDSIHFSNSKFHRFLTGSADFFDFETSKLHVDHKLFQVGYWLAFRYDDRDRLQYINEISEAESDKMMTISSVSSNLDLNNETKEPFSATEAKPFKWYFDIIMFDTGYEIGINEISNLTRKLSWESSMTVRAFIQSVATQFDNAELDYEVVLNSDFTIKKRLIHIKKKIGEVRDDIELRYGDNVKTVKRTTSISELCTAVRPVSKDDNDKVIDISSLNDWQELDEKGNVKFFHKKGTNLIFAPQANARFGNRGHNVTGGGYVVHDFSYDKVSQNELFNRSHIYLKEHSVPAINYEVDGRTGAKIGDTVKIVDDGYTPPLILSARVLEQVFSFDNASVEQATFGNYKALQSQISADLVAKMKQLAEENAPYKAQTLTTNGLTFKNSEGSTTLTARLYKGSKEIVSESYEWTINGIAITGNSEQYEITADDIYGKAVVRWSAVINGVTVAFDEVTITDVSDGTDGISPTVKINPDTSLTIVDAQGTRTTPVLKGTDGIAGKEGVGVKTTVITYAISTSGTTAPTTGWTSSVPSLVKGQYLWTKTVWTYTDNSSETGYSVTYISKDGNNGTNGLAGKDGVGIKTTTITYVGSASGTTAPTSGWTSAVPTVAAGSYLWTKTVWAYTDNTSETGYSVARMGLKGDKGDPGIKGNDGTDGTSGIIVSSVAPTSPQNGQLWQDTSTTPQLIKKWTGNEWVIWEFYAENIKAVTLETVSAKIGKIYNEFDNSSGGIDNKGKITIADSVKAVYYQGNSSTTIDLVTSSSGQGLFTQHLPDKTDASKFKQSWYMPTGLYFSDSINNWYGQITAENVTLVPWTNLTYLSGFTTAENNPCQYRKIKNLDGSYTVQFRGQVKPVSGKFSINTQYNPIRVPVDAQPATNKFGLGIGDFTGTQSARLVSFINDGANKGTIQVLVTGTASSYIAIDNLAYIL